MVEDIATDCARPSTICQQGAVIAVRDCAAGFVDRLLMPQRPLFLNSTPTKRGPTPRFQPQLERLSRLLRSKQRFVSEMLETVFSQAGR